MGEMGLLGVTVPEELGGLGLGYLEHTIAMEGELNSRPRRGGRLTIRTESSVGIGSAELRGKLLDSRLTETHN
jgi:alkylation response protein AidB-like acyl-CoA dehydrogenase